MLAHLGQVPCKVLFSHLVCLWPWSVGPSSGVWVFPMDDERLLHGLYQE